MHVIIIGRGKTVYFLAKQFASKGYQLTLINQDLAECRALSRHLKATVVHGDGSNPAILEEAGARQAEIVLALTPHDQDNLVTCQLAQRMYDVPRTVALVNDPDNEEVFRRLGITAAFSATRILLGLIEEQTGFEEITSLVPVAEGRVTVTELIVQPDAPAVGRSLQELQLPEGALIATIVRGDEVIIPKGGSRVLAGDRLILIGQPASYGDALRALTGETP
jgi:trk system potassium uptake protein